MESFALSRFIVHLIDCQLHRVVAIRCRCPSPTSLKRVFLERLIQLFLGGINDISIRSDSFNSPNAMLGDNKCN